MARVSARDEQVCVFDDFDASSMEWTGGILFQGLIYFLLSFTVIHLGHHIKGL